MYSRICWRSLAGRARKGFLGAECVPSAVGALSAEADTVSRSSCDGIVVSMMYCSCPEVFCVVCSGRDSCWVLVL